MDCGIYRDGRRSTSRRGRRDAPAGRGRGGFAWIGLHDPSPEEFDSVTGEFELHELLVEDALKAHQRAKIERLRATSYFVVLKTAAYQNPDDVVVGEIQFIIGPSFVLTIRHGDATPLTGCGHGSSATRSCWPWARAAVLYAVADRVVDDYVPVIEELETRRRRGRGGRLQRGAPEPGRAHLRAQAPGARPAPQRDAGASSGRTTSSGPMPAGRPGAARRTSATSHDHLQRVLGRARAGARPADRCPQRQPGPGQRAPEQRHAHDLGAGPR